MLACAHVPKSDVGQKRAKIVISHAEDLSHPLIREN